MNVKKMVAIVINKYGSENELMLSTVDKPSVGPGDVLIKTYAAGLNPVDYKTCGGQGISYLLDDHFPKVLGWDVSGEVCEVGKGITAFKVGDAVYGMINFPNLGKCYSEYVIAPEDQIAKKPINLSFLESAAVPLAGLTAYQALQLMDVKKGGKILIQAASGGVGHLAVQLAKQYELFVYATCSIDNIDFVKSLGADVVIDYTTEALADYIKPNELDYMLDSVCGEIGALSMNFLKTTGISVLLAIENSKIVVEKGKSQQKKTELFRVTPSQKDLIFLSKLFDEGKIKVDVSGIYEPNDIQFAHSRLQSSHGHGKLVLDFSHPATWKLH